MRRAAKRDGNERAIIEALEEDGWVVTQLSGPGLPDLVCLRDGKAEFVEVKAPGGKMEAAQVDLHELWERAGVTIAVVTSPEDSFFGGSAGRTATYRDFPWEGASEVEKRRRLATAPGRGRG